LKSPATIVCFECGSNGPPWIGTVDSIGHDLDALLYLADSGVLQVERIGDWLRISGRERVGLLLLPSGRKVIVRSKVPSLVILEWLAFLGEFPSLEAWLIEPAITTGKDLHACIGRLFLHEIETVTRRFFRKDFVPVKTFSSTVRGRLLITPLCRSMHHLPNVPQLARIRTVNTVYNIVLALALDKLPILLFDQFPHLRGQVARLKDTWGNVDREVMDVVSAVTEAQWACPPGYRNAIQLARLILIGAAIDPTSGAGGQVFTLSLAAIWERSLRRLFEELQDTTGWTILAASQRTRRWDDPEGQMDSKRWMTVDVLAERGSCHWVIDAKYKLGFADESRDDRFQMCAYAVGFSAERATLAYPSGMDALAQCRLLLNADIVGHSVRVDSVELPMVKGPEACKEAIIALCGGK
jgi:hypothetical protein